MASNVTFRTKTVKVVPSHRRRDKEQEKVLIFFFFFEKNMKESILL